jgi:putative ABC transport system permease protein
VTGRVPLARRNAFADRRRLVVSVLGVAAALALVVLIRSLWAGTLAQTSVFIDSVDADLIVVEPGTRSLAYEGSVLPASMIAEVAAIDGITGADGVIVRWVILDLHDKKVPVVLLGGAPGRPGSPWNVVDGRAPPREGEIAVDRSLADEHGIDLGHRVDVLGEGFTVVGMTDGTRSWMGGGYMFVTDGAARELLGGAEVASAVLVSSGDPPTVASAIETQLGLGVLTPDDIASADREFLAGVMRVPIELMALIAFVAGTMIVALTVYTSVVERFREYGVAVAIGADRATVARIVLGQTAAITALGVAATAPLYLMSSWLIAVLRPQFHFEATWPLVGSLVLTAGAMAVIAAIVPTRRLLHLEPATVYRGGG